MKLSFKINYTLICIALAVISMVVHHAVISATGKNLTYVGSATPVYACIVPKENHLTHIDRIQLAQCLGWQSDPSIPICHGFYQPLNISPLEHAEEIQLTADDVSLYAKARSKLSGNVEVRESNRIVNAQTAYIYRDAKTNKVTTIELLGNVRYLEPDRLMVAKKVLIHPQTRSGYAEDVLYRLNINRMGAILPAWGKASWVERFANHNDLLRKATYTTCAPSDKAWQIDAKEITLDHTRKQGIARNAVLRVADWPVIYAPYLSFPTTNERKSGFLMPMAGYSNVGGYDLALPYYWNIAPNQDATIVPHLYTQRGLMMGGDYRFLTKNSLGMIDGHFLPKDRAFNEFIQENEQSYPSLQGTSSDRWAVLVQDHTAFTPNLHMNIQYQQVSDSYYLQDFSSNLALLTENQLLREGDLSYTTNHWFFRGMVESYQTLHPIDQSVISNIYTRAPQLVANGSYSNLPLNANFNVLSEFDYFQWPSEQFLQPEGPRYHLNPSLSLPYNKPWGHITPTVQLQENLYAVNYIGENYSNEFNRTIPMYSIDSGLAFERSTVLFKHGLTQTLEPRLFYLNVPYQNQTPIPTYDSAYMIFNADQLFRTNRFSGFDRIGDANQLTYALTSRWLEETGKEKASFTVGQIRYFAERKVQLCYQQTGSCIDNPYYLGYVSPVATSSPIASRAVYQLSSKWILSGDYVWDVYSHSTNNGNLNFHFQPAINQILNLNYSYLGNGNLIQAPNAVIQNSALHQGTIAAATPLTERWSGIGAYSYNISKGYGMMTFLGLQYDNCCWAMRLMGGRTFKSLTPGTFLPEYNNNVYFQVLLKGLGSVANSDPATIISTYLPSYQNMF